MQVILSDHNREGQARDIFDVLKHDGIWLELVPMKLRWFHQVGLSFTAPDEEVWQLCQKNGYLLLTDNRTADDGEDSLELSILRLITPDILPVLTIGNVKRVNSDRAYRRACAEKLAEIVDELHLYRGVIRLYIP